MDVSDVLAIATVVAVVAFDYSNGFHDAANIIATPIASRAMTPISAVTVVAVFEFLGPMLGGTAVANTIGRFIDMSDLASALSLMVILCGVIGAIVGDFFFGRGEVGIGQLLRRYANNLNGEELLAAVMMSSALGIVVFWTFGWLQNLIIGKWHETVQK